MDEGAQAQWGVAGLDLNSWRIGGDVGGVSAGVAKGGDRRFDLGERPPARVVVAPQPSEPG